jgi:predicted PilT family ATPase
VFFYDQYNNHLQPVFKCRDKVENLEIHTKHSINVYVENLKVSILSPPLSNPTRT